MKKLSAILVVAAMVLMLVPFSAFAAAGYDANAKVNWVANDDSVNNGDVADIPADAKMVYITGAAALTTGTIAAPVIVADTGSLSISGDATLPAKISAVEGGTVEYANDADNNPTKAFLTTPVKAEVAVGTAAAPDLETDATSIAAAVTAAGNGNNTISEVKLTGTETEVELKAAPSTKVNANSKNIGVTGTVTLDKEIAGAGAVTVGTGAGLTVAAGTGKLGATAVNVEGEGTLTNNGAIEAGAMTVEDGTKVTTAAGSTTTVTGALTITDGELDNAGTMTVGSTAGTGTVGGAGGFTNNTPAPGPGPVVPPVAGGGYQIVWGQGGSASNGMWARPSDSSPTNTWASAGSNNSNKTNPSMGGK